MMPRMGLRLGFNESGMPAEAVLFQRCGSAGEKNAVRRSNPMRKRLMIGSLRSNSGEYCRAANPGIKDVTANCVV